MLMLQYFSRDCVTLLTEREDIHSLGWFAGIFLSIQYIHTWTYLQNVWRSYILPFMECVNIVVLKNQLTCCVSHMLSSQLLLLSARPRVIFCCCRCNFTRTISNRGTISALYNTAFTSVNTVTSITKILWDFNEFLLTYLFMYMHHCRVLILSIAFDDDNFIIINLNVVWIIKKALVFAWS